MNIKNAAIVHPICEYNKLIVIECINEANYHTDKPPYDIYLLDKSNNLIAHFQHNEPFSVEALDTGNLFVLKLYNNDHKLYKVNENNTYSLLNTYEDIEFGIENGTYAVKRNDLWGFIDKNGKEIIPAQYINYSSFCNGFAFVRNKKRKWGAINKKNEIIIPFEYCRRSYFCRGYAVLKKEDLSSYDVYDTKGRLVFEGKKHQKIFNLGNGCILAENKNTKEFEIVSLEE